MKSPAAMYTYAKAKGLFVGINLGGTLVLERKKANEKYGGHKRMISENDNSLETVVNYYFRHFFIYARL